MIIIDMGSGNTCRNDLEVAKDMISKVTEALGSTENCFLKWQLFEEAGDNVPLNIRIYREMLMYAVDQGWEDKITASVFDEVSLWRLLWAHSGISTIPFIKVACRPDLYPLTQVLPIADTWIVSVSNEADMRVMIERPEVRKALFCVSEYPAQESDYAWFRFAQIYALEEYAKMGISDHTEGWLQLKEQCFILAYEFHFRLPESTGLDAGPWAKTPEQIKEWVNA